MTPLLAFVLVSEDAMPNAESLPATFLKWGVEATGWEEKNGTVELAAGGRLMFAFMPGAIPKNEADQAARFSAGNLGEGARKMGPHAGHVVVTRIAEKGRVTTLEDVLRFTRAVAAISEWSEAVGVYWGAGNVAHDARFFRTTVDTIGIPVSVWSGVTMAQANGRVRYLSLGMTQFELPELVVTAPLGGRTEALDYFFKLAVDAIRRGAAFTDGYLVGRGEQERVPVLYEPSPIRAGERIAVVHLTE